MREDVIPGWTKGLLHGENGFCKGPESGAGISGSRNKKANLFEMKWGRKRKMEAMN